MDAISIRQLRTFAAVARHKGFSTAADALNLSQPALTQHIQQLEAHLRVALFDRKARTVELTRAGSQFLEAVQHLLRDFDLMVEDARTLAEHRRGTARIACPASMTAQIVVPAIRDLRVSHPGITVSVKEIDEPGVQELVRNGQVDFALSGTWLPSADLLFQEKFKDRACVLFSKGHVLARASTITLNELREETLIGSPTGTAAELFVTRAEAESGLAFRTACEVSQLMSTALIVEQGIGFAILPALSAMTVSRLDVSMIPLEAPRLWRTCGYVFSLRRSLPPAAELLISFLDQQIQKLQSPLPETLEIF